MTAKAPMLDQAAPQPADSEYSVSAADWAVANQRYLAAALDVVRLRLAGKDVAPEERRRDDLRSQMQGSPALDRVVVAFGLSPFERDVLLLCTGAELDTAVAAACAMAQGDPHRPYATFNLAMAALPQAHWSATLPTAPLRRWRLVGLDEPDALMTAPLRIDVRVMHELMGLSYLDPRLEVLEQPYPTPPELGPSLQEAAARLAALWAAGRRPVHLSGRPDIELRAAVSEASFGLGLMPVRLHAADLPSASTDRDLLVRLCERETALSGRCWLIEIDNESDVESRAAIDFALWLQAPVALLGRLGRGKADPGLPAIEVPPSAAPQSPGGPRVGLPARPRRPGGPPGRRSAKSTAAALELTSDSLSISISRHRPLSAPSLSIAAGGSLSVDACAACTTRHQTRGRGPAPRPPAADVPQPAPREWYGLLRPQRASSGSTSCDGPSSGGPSDTAARGLTVGVQVVTVPSARRDPTASRAS